MLASPPRFQVGGGGALSPARAYVAPSLAVAHAERLKKHPSEEDPSGHSRRLFRCCTPAGRFCFNSCAWFDPCCEGKESSFVLYGAGTTSYFKGIKLLGALRAPCPFKRALPASPLLTPPPPLPTSAQRGLRC
jgi:hypothetical protein